MGKKLAHQGLKPTTEATSHKVEHKGVAWHRSATEDFGGYQALVWMGGAQASGPVERGPY